MKEMEMPTPCQHCGEWFDLNDGCTSEKWYPNTVICDDCANEEEIEMALDDEIENLMCSIDDARFTIDEATRRLLDLGIKY